MSSSSTKKPSSKQPAGDAVTPFAGPKTPTRYWTPTPLSPIAEASFSLSAEHATIGQRSMPAPTENTPSDSPMMWKPKSLWMAHPKLVRVDSDEPHKHGLYCKTKSKAKGVVKKLSHVKDKQQPESAATVKKEPCKHKFRQGRCKRCLIPEFDEPAATSGAFCVNKRVCGCDNADGDADEDVEVSCVSEVAPQLEPIQVQGLIVIEDNEASPASTRLHNDESTLLYDVPTSPTVDTDVSSVTEAAAPVNRLPRLPGTNNLLALVPNGIESGYDTPRSWFTVTDEGSVLDIDLPNRRLVRRTGSSIADTDGSNSLNVVDMPDYGLPRLQACNNLAALVYSDALDTQSDSSSPVLDWEDDGLNYHDIVRHLNGRTIPLRRVQARIVPIPLRSFLSQSSTLTEPSNDEHFIAHWPSDQTVNAMETDRYNVVGLSDGEGGGDVVLCFPEDLDSLQEAPVQALPTTTTTTEQPTNPTPPQELATNLVVNIMKLPSLPSLRDLSPVTQHFSSRVRDKLGNRSSTASSQVSESTALKRIDLIKTDPYIVKVAEKYLLDASKLPFDILQGLVRAAVYGDSRCQETLLKIHRDCMVQPQAYTPEELRSIRKGYLMLDLHCLALAKFTTWDLVDSVRKQLFSQPTDGKRLEEMVFRSLVHHSVRNGTLPKMSAVQILLLNSTDDSDQESEAEKAIFQDKELFGPDGYIQANQGKVIDRALDVDMYDDLASAEEIAAGPVSAGEVNARLHSYCNDLQEYVAGDQRPGAFNCEPVQEEEIEISPPLAEPIPATPLKNSPSSQSLRARHDSASPEKSFLGYRSGLSRPLNGTLEDEKIDSELGYPTETHDRQAHHMSLAGDDLEQEQEDGDGEEEVIMETIEVEVEDLALREAEEIEEIEEEVEVERIQGPLQETEPQGTLPGRLHPIDLMQRLEGYLTRQVARHATAPVQQPCSGTYVPSLWVRWV